MLLDFSPRQYFFQLTDQIASAAFDRGPGAVFWHPFHYAIQYYSPRQGKQMPVTRTAQNNAPHPVHFGKILRNN